MGNPFMAEIKIISWNFAPQGWAFANGQLLPINQNQALFSLLGTMYGGNGQTNFALPDLRSRVPIHMGAGHTLGEKGGQEFHTVTQSEMPTHIHQLNASTTVGNSAAANNTIFAGAQNLYGQPTNLTTLSPDTVTNIGGSQPHENRQPYLVLNFVIALQGIFPSQT